MSEQGVHKNNILSLEGLQEQHKETFKMAEAYVDFNGEMLSYKYYEKLPETKKNEYIQEFMEFSYKLTNDEEYRKLTNASVPYAFILMVDKFTDIDVPEDDMQRLVYASYLTDFGLLDKILNTLPTEEVTSVMEKGTEVVAKQTERLKTLLEQYESQTGEIEDMSSLRLVEQELSEEEAGE